jgi:hypothetical protein
MTKNVAPAQLVKEANLADKLFCDAWSGIKKNTLELGRAIVLIEEKALHKYIPKGNSRKGYQSVEEYALAKTNGELSHTKLYDAKRIYLLTQGENAIPAEVVTQMPKRNQLQVARIAKATGGKVEPEVIQKAISEPVLKFAETAQDAVNATKPPEKRKEPLTDVVLRGIHVRIANEFYELMDDMKGMAIVRDGDFDVNLESKALLAIVTSARSWAQDIINKHKKALHDKAPEIPPAIDEAVEADADQADEEPIFTAPDAGERTGRAEAEGRLVHRKSEARN